MRLVLLWLAPLLGAQTTGTVEGTVIDSVTHTPIAGVKVFLNCTSNRDVPSYHATTGTNGIFHVAVAEGVYEASLIEDSHYQSWETKPFAVVAKETARVRLELDPVGKLRGRVLDLEGRPVAKAAITLAHLLGGSASAGAVTREDGSFEVEGLGTYTLMARPPANIPAVPTYYPRAIERSSAEHIRLRPGALLEGYVVRLQTPELFHVRGMVRDENGKPAAGASIQLKPPDAWNGAWAWQEKAKSGEDGTFDIPSVWPRDWEIEAELALSHGDVVAKGFNTFTLARRDVEGLEIHLSPAFTVRVVVDGPKDAGYSGVWMFSPSGEAHTETGPDGIPRVLDVYPGRYRIRPSGRPAGYYFDSILFGDRDVTGQEVYIGDGSTPIRVVFKPGPGRISGTVEKCSGGIVVLWGLDEPIIDSEYFHRTTCESKGRFGFEELRPGNYYIVAFASVGDWYLLQDIDFARALSQQSAARVRVEKGETATIELKLTPWPE